MLYAYVKKKPVRPRFRFSRRLARFVSVVFLCVGLVLLGQVILPIASSFLVLLPQYSSEIASPLASYVAPIAQANESLSVLPLTNSDPYRPSTWFANTNSQPIGGTNLRTYSLSIPRLKIDSAIVTFGGDDLKKSLVAWPTSALPGSYGANIIFGHSELPSLANTKDYAGIFTFLMDLESGDEIFIDSDGIRYKYVVFEKKVIEPTNLSILEQRFDRAYLTLITCVPPGTLWKRGVIKAALEKT